MTFDKRDKIEILENALSWIVVMAMLIYGGAKIIQFDGASEINTPVSELTGMQLMWAFYGHSKPFALTLGFFEITGGLLILFKKTRILGCLFTSTILVNVILQDIFYDINRGALIAAIIYQICIIIILLLNRVQIINSLRLLLKKTSLGQTTTKFFAKLGIAFILFVLLRITEFYLTH